MTISEIEQQHLEIMRSGNCDVDSIVIVNTSQNPCFLQLCAFAHNWNDGMQLPTAIACHQSCDLGTALTLFWLAGGMSYYLKEVTRNEYNHDWADFCELMINKLTSGVYPSSCVSYQPNINKLTRFKYRKAAIPAVLYQGVNGMCTCAYN